MKIKSILAGLCLLLTGTLANAQNGLENIVIEKYYVSNAADQASANSDLSGAGYTTGTLPVGSVTWRIYADLLPGWGVQSVYGIPSHPLSLTTSTSFFNHPNGNTTGGNFSSNGTGILGSGTTLLDSYLACGAVAPGRYGVLKSEDNSAAVPTGGGNNYIAGAATVLANNDPSAAPALTSFDGIYNVGGTPALLALTLLGDAAAAPVNIFTDGSVVGGTYNSTNTSWGVLGEQVGAFPTGTNRVLIGQFTSDGVFSYNLNIQLRNNTTFAVQQYVPSNATGAEILFPALAGTLNQPNLLPSVSVLTPSTGASFLVGNTVNFTASASDPDGSIASVQWLVDGSPVGAAQTVAPYSFNWTAVAGAHTITARATDNNGGQTTSAPVSITVGVVVAPSVSITAPSNGATAVEGQSITVSANATDDGAVDSVVFFANGLFIGVDATAPYSVSWTATEGAIVLTARATDNIGAQTTSAPVNITVFDSSAAYAIISSVNECQSSTFCLPINALQPVNDVIGYDVVLNYDKTKVIPNGVITVAFDLINANYTSVASSIDTAAGQMLISVFFNGTAPANAEFNGSGELLCVGFAKTAGFGSEDTAVFTIPTLQESYINGVNPKVVTPGDYVTYQDSLFTSELRFWSNNLPIKYDAANPNEYLITNIYGSSNATCDTASLAVGTAVQPDLFGNFTYNTNNGSYINLQHDIAATTSVQPVINGFDAFLTRRVLINDATFLPSIYQVLAMDVNLDGVISAGDLSQINQRTVLILPEFRQAWNYSAGGSVLNNRLPSRDWTFVDNSRLNSDNSYLISTTYPANDGIGYSKFDVPVVPFCLEVPSDTQGTCIVLDQEIYTGILLGDVNGNYATVANNGAFRSAADQVVLDFASAKVSGNYVDVPVTFTASEAINAVDFAVVMNNSNLTYHSVSTSNSSVEVLANVAADNTLRLTSSSLETLENGQTVATVRFSVNSGSFNASDITLSEGYLNGEKAGISATGVAAAADVNVYPNPARGILNVVSVEDATVQILDLEGRMLMPQMNVNAFQKYEINISTLADGVYMVKIFNGNFSSMKKIVVKK